MESSSTDLILRVGNSFLHFFQIFRSFRQLSYRTPGGKGGILGTAESFRSIFHGLSAKNCGFNTGDLCTVENI